MKLLCEIQDHVESITEEENGKKKMYIEGIFMQSGIANKNNRRYHPDVMENEVRRYIKDSVEKNRAYGELSHPQGPQINLDRVSHIIKSLRVEGRNVMGKALVLETPMGKIVRGLIEGGANLGVSSRGLGTLKPGKDNVNEVQSDFKLVTPADVVADPSAPDAWVSAVMENVEWVWDEAKGDWTHMEEVEDTKNQIKKMSSSELNERKLRLFSNFLKTL